MSIAKPYGLMYGGLLKCFGSGNVAVDKDVPNTGQSASFYIPSRDLYISCFCGLSHGGYPYGLDNEGDARQLSEWSRRASLGEREYLTAGNTWADSDVRLRNGLKAMQANYVSFWMTDLSDFRLWLDMGAPDGRDYERPYSWIPYRYISGVGLCGDLRRQKDSTIAKHFQCKVFYDKEREMWNHDVLLSRAGKRVHTQAAIFINRYIHRHKLPSELSDFEILETFRSMGIVSGYTSFDTELMEAFIRKYHIKCLYDPCAGWGERMLCCRRLGCVYLGVDINARLESGYATMRDVYKMFNQRFLVSDSALFDAFDCEYDAVFTCPPYGDTEYYYDLGAENLPEDAFGIWWSNVVHASAKSGCRYFCVVTNQVYKNLFLDGIVENGFHLIEECDFRKQGSGSTRGSGRHKRSFESLLICERDGQN